jgi:hypothetical protein
MKKSKTEIVEDILKYFIIGLFGTAILTATLGAIFILCLRLTQMPLNFLIGALVFAGFAALGYIYNLIGNFIDRKLTEREKRTYKEEDMEPFKPQWIKRGVTTVEWPYIPDDTVQKLIQECAEEYDQRNGTTMDFEIVSEYLEEKDQETGEHRQEILNDFLTEHDLELEDTINYWW